MKDVDNNNKKANNDEAIKFIDEEYLTVCVKKKENEMFGDVCMVVYPSQWENIKLMGGHHRDR